jgi:hypothetical protein
MSLRAFHLFFIAISIVLAAFMAAWSAGEYRALHDSSYALATAAALAAAAGLAFYAAAFRKKTRHL